MSTVMLGTGDLKTRPCSVSSRLISVRQPKAGQCSAAISRRFRGLDIFQIYWGSCKKVCLSHLFFTSYMIKYLSRLTINPYKQTDLLIVQSCLSVVLFVPSPRLTETASWKRWRPLLPKCISSASCNYKSWQILANSKCFVSFPQYFWSRRVGCSSHSMLTWNLVSFVCSSDTFLFWFLISSDAAWVIKHTIALRAEL